MADEQTPTGSSDVTLAGPDAAVPVVKKQRAPRTKKAPAEAKTVSSPAKSAKVDGRKKRVGKSTDVTPAAAPEPVAVKRRGNDAAAKKSAVVARAPASAGDEMAELLHLEDENKRLRKTLADKLRAENADLRKKLGLA